MRPDSPEDRLLRLIKGVKPRPKGDTGKTVASSGKEPFLAAFISKIFLKSRIFKPSFLSSANKILPIILAIISVYLIYSFLFMPRRDIKTIAGQKEGLPRDIQASLGSQETALLPQREEYSAYSKEMEGKELFTAPYVAESPGLGSTSVDISKKFSLVGIIAGAEPQAIIEDTETQKTYYLYKGQSFNGVTLQEIGDGKVIISHKGKEVILVL